MVQNVKKVIKSDYYYADKTNLQIGRFLTAIKRKLIILCSFEFDWTISLQKTFHILKKFVR